MKRRTGPAGIAIVLILVVAILGVAWNIIDRYIPSKTVIDATEYFEVENEGEAAIVLKDHIEERKALESDGRIYVAYELVKEGLNDHFYRDASGSQTILTTAEDIIKIPDNSAEYTTISGNGSMPYAIAVTQGEDCYLALDFVQQYTDITYTQMENPARVVIQGGTETRILAEVIKEEAVRLGEGIKEPILMTPVVGDTLTVLEQGETWTKVLTSDGFIGFVRNKRIDNVREETFTSSFQAPEYTSLHKDYGINLVWHQITSQESNAAFETDMQEVSGVNVVSPTWFSISTNAGDITSLANADYVAQAHAKGMEVWGLLDNFSADISTLEILSNTASREWLIQQLLTEAMTYQLDGINIDIESLQEEAAECYIQFMRELSVHCRKAGLVLSVDVPPPYEFNAHYNRAALGEVVDYVIVMGYDEHYVGTEPGSVASLSFERDGITGTLQSVPKEKIISGIPFYTRLWKTDSAGEVSSDAIGMNVADEILAGYQVKANWSQDHSQDYAEFTDEEGNFCQIWLENEASIEEKMKLVQEYKLAGAAAWKLGLERASIWEIISKYL